MKPSFFCAMLLAVICSQCAQPTSSTVPQGNSDLDWSGEYHFYGFGLDAHLGLRIGGQFSFSSWTSPGSIQYLEGTWLQEEDWIRLSLPIPWIRDRQEVSRLKLSVFGPDQFLIPEGFNVSHLEHGWNPIDTGFLRGGIERRNVLEKEAFTARFESIKAEGLVYQSWCGTCNPGSENEVCEGEVYEPPPSRSDFDWIICGETTMAEIRARLGDPSGVGTRGPQYGVKRATFRYLWKCEPYSYIREDDHDWEWGPVNAAKLREEIQAYYDQESEMSKMHSHMLFVEPGEDDLTKLTAAGLYITFHEKTYLVWHKVFWGPPEDSEH